MIAIMDFHGVMIKLFLRNLAPEVLRRTQIRWQQSCRPDMICIFTARMAEPRQIWYWPKVEHLK